MNNRWHVTPGGLIVLSLAGWQGIRFIASLQHAETLRAYAPVPGPTYIALSGLFWALLLGLAAWRCLRRGSRFGLPALPVTAAYLAWFWSDRLLLQYHIPPGGSNRSFLLLLHSLLLARLWWEQSSGKRKENRHRERKPEDQKTA